MVLLDQQRPQGYDDQGFRGVQIEGSCGAARGKCCGLGLSPAPAPGRRGTQHSTRQCRGVSGKSLTASVSSSWRGWGLGGGLGPKSSLSGLSCPHHTAELMDKSHFLGPELLDFQRWEALPGALSSSPFQSNSQDMSVNLLEGEEIYCVPPPSLAWPKPNSGMRWRAEGKSQVLAGQAQTFGSSGPKGQHRGRGSPVGSVDT